MSETQDAQWSSKRYVLPLILVTLVVVLGLIALLVGRPQSGDNFSYSVGFDKGLAAAKTTLKYGTAGRVLDDGFVKTVCQDLGASAINPNGFGGGANYVSKDVVVADFFVGCIKGFNETYGPLPNHPVNCDLVAGCRR